MVGAKHNFEYDSVVLITLLSLTLWALYCDPSAQDRSREPNLVLLEPPVRNNSKYFMKFFYHASKWNGDLKCKRTPLKSQCDEIGGRLAAVLLMSHRDQVYVIFNKILYLHFCFVNIFCGRSFSLCYYFLLYPYFFYHSRLSFIFPETTTHSYRRQIVNLNTGELSQVKSIYIIYNS